MAVVAVIFQECDRIVELVVQRVVALVRSAQLISEHGVNHKRIYALKEKNKLWYKLMGKYFFNINFWDSGTV